MLVTRELMGVELPGVCDDVNFRMGRFWRGGRAARVGYGNVRACQASGQVAST